MKRVICCGIRTREGWMNWAKATSELLSHSGFRFQFFERNANSKVSVFEAMGDNFLAETKVESRFFNEFNARPSWIFCLKLSKFCRQGWRRVFGSNVTYPNGLVPTRLRNECNTFLLKPSLPFDWSWHRIRGILLLQQMFDWLKMNQARRHFLFISNRTIILSTTFATYEIVSKLEIFYESTPLVCPHQGWLYRTSQRRSTWDGHCHYTTTPGVAELTIRTHVEATSITEPMPPEPKSLKRSSIRVLSWPVVA